MPSKLAIVFQGNIRTDARVLRETLSLAKYWDVDVYSSNVEQSDKNLVPKNVQIFEFALDNFWLFRNIFFGKQYNALLKDLDPLKYDVILCIDYPTLELGVKLKKRNPNLKVWYDSHEIYIETINQFFPRSGWRQMYGRPLIALNQVYHSRRELKLVQNTDKIITVCDSLQCFFETRWKRSVVVLRNCPMLEHFEENYKDAVSRADFGIKKEDFLLIYQGDVNPGRGLNFLLDVMRLLPSNYHLIIVGDGMLRHELEQKALKIKNVRFIGKVPYLQLQEYTRLADLGINLIEPINASKRLSLPNKLFEYMACGLPFMSNNLPEPRAIVEQYGTGILVEMENIQNVVNTIVSIKEDEKSRIEMGKKGIQTFRDDLNWQQEFNKIIRKLY